MPRSESFLVGVAGPTCAGKTTLEHNLEVALGNEVSVLPFDDMTLDLDDPEEIGADSWESPECYRWEDYRRHLKDLRLGQATIVHVNYWEIETPGLRERLIEPRPIVVSVGFLALYDEIACNQFDLKLYLHIPEEEIIKRRAKIERIIHPSVDPMPYIMNHVIPATRELVEPQREHADLVIDGLQSRADILEAAIEKIRLVQN